MSHADHLHRRLELCLASLLSMGTWLACALITVGIALSLIVGCTRTPFLMAGIALIIFLPVLRLLFMLTSFLRARDFPLAAVAALVLTIIALGAVFGVA
jgi:uncharacterized membrane protein